jgi:hypothetical protein
LLCGSIILSSEEFPPAPPSSSCSKAKNWRPPRKQNNIKPVRFLEGFEVKSGRKDGTCFRERAFQQNHKANQPNLVQISPQLESDLTMPSFPQNTLSSYHYSRMITLILERTTCYNNRSQSNFLIAKHSLVGSVDFFCSDQEPSRTLHHRSPAKSWRKLTPADGNNSQRQMLSLV